VCVDKGDNRERPGVVGVVCWLGFRLWEAVHAFANVHIDTVVVYQLMEIVLFEDGWWYLLDWDPHVFVVFHWSI
jgi:hypothetical protein